MIEEELEIGIKILAYIHSGEIEIGCHNCSDNEAETLNCNNFSAENIVFQDEDLGEFTNCPVKWITKQVYEFYDEYYYYKLFPGTAPKYGFGSLRFWDCVKIYESTTNMLQNRKMKKSSGPNEQKTTTDLAKLKSEFQQRKK